MSAQIEKWGQHYWVVYYDDNRNRFDESGPYTEVEDAEDCLERVNWVTIGPESNWSLVEFAVLIEEAK